jgi:hypothetical protein
MKRILEWWYRLSLPALEQGTTPLQRERARYAKLTSSFLLLLLVLFLPLAPIMIFDSPRSPSSPPIAIGMLFLLLASWVYPLLQEYNRSIATLSQQLLSQRSKSSF